MLIGCISAIFAMMVGLYDRSKIQDNTQTESIINKHMYTATTAWCFYIVSVYLRWNGDVFTHPNVSAIITSVIGFVILLLAGWYGALLVYQQGVGINKNGRCSD